MGKRCRAWQRTPKFYETMPTLHNHRSGFSRRCCADLDALAPRQPGRRFKLNFWPDAESAVAGCAGCHEQPCTNEFSAGGDANETKFQSEFAGRDRRIWRL